MQEHVQLFSFARKVQDIYSGDQSNDIPLGKLSKDDEFYSMASEHLPALLDHGVFELTFDDRLVFETTASTREAVKKINGQDLAFAFEALTYFGNPEEKGFNKLMRAHAGMDKIKGNRYKVITFMPLNGDHEIYLPEEDKYELFDYKNENHMRVMNTSGKIMVEFCRCYAEMITKPKCVN